MSQAMRFQGIRVAGAFGYDMEAALEDPDGT